MAGRIYGLIVLDPSSGEFAPIEAEFDVHTACAPFVGNATDGSLIAPTYWRSTMTSYLEGSHRIGSRSVWAMLKVIAACMVACNGESASESAAASESPAALAAQATAVMELGEESYTFERVTCDLDDSIDDDILLRAGGTATDGRRMSLEVERREVGDMLHDRVTLYFGSLMDGDQWHSYATGQPGGTWTTLQPREPLDGPLVVIQDGELTAEGTFKHETRDETHQGAVRVRCEG